MGSSCPPADRVHRVSLSYIDISCRRSLDITFDSFIHSPKGYQLFVTSFHDQALEGSDFLPVFTLASLRLEQSIPWVFSEYLFNE